MLVTGAIMGDKRPYVWLDEEFRFKLGVRRLLWDKDLERVLTEAGLSSGDWCCVDLDEGAHQGVFVYNAAYPKDYYAEQEIEATIEDYEPLFDVPDGLFQFPQVDHSFVIEKDVAAVLNAIKALVMTDSRVNLRLTGPQGTGKTSLAMAIAASLGWAFAKVDTGMVTEREDWWCDVKAVKDDGASVTHADPSLFLHAITRPQTVVLLDEFNRAPTEVHNAIYGMLDEHGFGFSSDLQMRIDRADRVLVIATMNVEDTNVGTFELDSAIKDRFPFEIRLELLPEDKLAEVIETRSGCDVQVAAQLARLAHEVEDLVGSTLAHGTGTRSLIAAAKLIEKGIGWLPACQATVVAMFDHRGGTDSERAIVANMVMGLNIF